MELIQKTIRYNQEGKNYAARRKAEEKICAENGLQAAPYVKEYCW